MKVKILNEKEIRKLLEYKETIEAQVLVPSSKFKSLYSLYLFKWNKR